MSEATKLIEKAKLQTQKKKFKNRKISWPFVQKAVSVLKYRASCVLEKKKKKMARSVVGKETKSAHLTMSLDDDGKEYIETVNGRKAVEHAAKSMTLRMIADDKGEKLKESIDIMGNKVTSQAIKTLNKAGKLAGESAISRKVTEMCSNLTFYITKVIPMMIVGSIMTVLVPSYTPAAVILQLPIVGWTVTLTLAVCGARAGYVVAQVWFNGDPVGDSQPVGDVGMVEAALKEKTEGGKRRTRKRTRKRTKRTRKRKRKRTRNNRGKKRTKHTRMRKPRKRKRTKNTRKH